MYVYIYIYVYTYVVWIEVEQICAFISKIVVLRQQLSSCIPGLRIHESNSPMHNVRVGKIGGSTRADFPQTRGRPASLKPRSSTVWILTIRYPACLPARPPACLPAPET